MLCAFSCRKGLYARRLLLSESSSGSAASSSARLPAKMPLKACWSLLHWLSSAAAEEEEQPASVRMPSRTRLVLLAVRTASAMVCAMER
jgi:hypothetical protein